MKAEEALGGVVDGRISLGSGQSVPYPVPTSAAATRIVRANTRRDTTPELALRRELHRRGMRFRVDLPVRVGMRRAVRVDVAFTRPLLAVFVDGCFWHCCPDHMHMPKANVAYWRPKLQANVDRDRAVDEAFRASGWTVLRVWEHTDPADAADVVQATYLGLVGDGR